MKITIIGGTGLIGSRLARSLQRAGHEVFVAARSMGISSYTGKGLEDAFGGTDVLVNVSNSTFRDEVRARGFSLPTQ